MIPYVGDFAEDATVYHYFNTFDSNDPSASVTITNLASTDLYVHKDGSVTDIVTDGATITIDFDSITGSHKVEIDTSVHADYATGSDYMVRMEGTTVDGATINAALFTFSIENRYNDVNVVTVSGTSQTANDNGLDINTLITGVSLNAGAITNASLAGNMEIVFETDFATNYNTTRDSWVTNTQDTVGTGSFDTATGFMASYTQPTGFLAATFNAEVGASSTAMNNLELMYDGNGYTDDTAPASRSQLDSLAVTGAAVNVSARSAPDGFVMTTGVETTNDEDATQSLDGTRHVLDESGTTLDCYYKFYIGGSSLPTSVTFTGIFNGGNDDFGIYANAGTDASPTWQQIGTLEGTNSAVNVTHTFTLLSGQIVSDVTGEVQIRVYSTTLTNCSFDVDQVFVSKAIVSNSVGYANGCIWVDTAGSNTNTESYVDGVADNPVSTWAAALTLNTQLGLNRFNIAAGSAITLTADATSYMFFGQSYSVALAGYDIDGAYFFGANVSGIGTADSANHPVFEDCPIGTVTLPPSIMRRCFLSGTITNSAAGDWFINHSMSRVAGSSSPTFDFGAAVANTNLNMRLYSGGIQIDNKDANGTDLMSIEGNGALTVNSGSSGAISCRGNFKVTNTGGATITCDDNTTNTAAILADTNEVQTDLADGGRLDIILDAVHGKTEQMLFTNTNELDVNTKSINDAEVVGDGNATPWDGV